MKKVSVIVPVYNAGKQLTICIESIISQSYPDLEIILIDDGSTDESGWVCDKMAIKNTAVKVLHQTNHGVSYTRNVGVRAASGDYICFVDSDDWVEPNFVEELVSAMESNHADIAMCGWYENERLFSLEKDRLEYNREDFLYYLFSFFDGHYFALWNKIFKRELVGEFDETVSYLEDGIFICKYVKRAYKAVIVPKMLYHYIENSSSLTHCSKPTLQRLSAFQGRLKMAGLVEEYPVIAKIARAKYQETVRYILFTSYLAGYYQEIRPHIPELKRYRKEFYSLDLLSLKAKIRNFGYGVIIHFNLGTKVASWWERLRRDRC